MELGASLINNSYNTYDASASYNRTPWTADFVQTVRMTDTPASRLRIAREKAGFRTAVEAAAAHKLNPNTLTSNENGNRPISRKMAPIYAEKFGVEAGWLLYGEEGSEIRTARNVSFPPRYEAFPSGTVPLLGQTSGGANGRFILNGAEVGRLFCPPNLQGVDGAYAVRVYGTSMEPRFMAGEAVWLNPYEPVRTGDDVVVQIETEPGEIESYIKRFVSRSAGILRLQQFNPDEGEEAELTFDARKVAAIHKVVFHAMA